MTLSRRKFIALAGGGAVFAAAGAAAYDLTRPLGAALRPWDMAGTPEDPRRRALSYVVVTVLRKANLLP